MIKFRHKEFNPTESPCALLAFLRKEHNPTISGEKLTTF